MAYSIETLLADLKEKFTSFSFQFREIEYCGKIPVFFINVDCKETLLSEKWSDIVEFIAVNYQTSLKEEFSVWNIYLFFITKHQISDSLKYRIENDTFSSRKILIEYEANYEEIIEQNIINKDLILVPSNTEKSDSGFKPNPLIWSFLQKKEANKRLNQDDRDYFKKIVSNIKKTNNEI